MSNLNAKNILPVIATALTAVSASCTSPVTTPETQPEARREVSNETSVISQAMSELRERIEEAGKVYDSRVVKCSTDQGFGMGNFLESGSFFELVKLYFKTTGGNLEGMVSSNGEGYYLVRFKEGYKVFKISDYIVQYYHEASNMGEARCAQAVPIEGGISRHVQEVPFKGDPKAWFDRLSREAEENFRERSRQMDENFERRSRQMDEDFDRRSRQMDEDFDRRSRQMDEDFERRSRQMDEMYEGF